VDRPISFTVCFFVLFFCFLVFACVYVRLRISPPRIKLAASNFARRLIGVQGRESHILGNFAPPEAQNRTNLRARHHLHDVLNDYHLAPTHDRAACGHIIGMCGYTSVPEDGRTCLNVFVFIS